MRSEWQTLPMAFMAAALPVGGEVVISSHTMVATATAIHFAGLKPVPTDPGPDHLLDCNGIEACITDATVAICPTQLNGRTCDMDRLMQLASDRGLAVLEDAAQALGSRFDGRCAGTFGLAGCISCYPAKLLGCLGDGGAVLTNEDAVYEKLLLLRDHGRGRDGDVHLWGFNSRLDNLQASFLNAQFGSYSGVIAHRRDLADHYHERLRECESLMLPPHPDQDPRHFDVFQNYEIEAEDRDRLKRYLADREIDTLIQWGGKAIHHFSKLGFDVDLPHTDALFDRLLMLPLNMSLAIDDVDYVCDSVLEFYGQRRTGS